jgi:predicted RND superfamily exporter protein
MTKRESVTQKFFDRVVLEYPRAVMLLVLGLCVLLGAGVGRFRLDASSETLVMENDESLLYSRIVSSRYGQHDFLVLTYKPKGDLFSGKSLDTLGKLRDELKSLQRVVSVRSILDVPLVESSGLSLVELTSDLPTLEDKDFDNETAKVEFGSSSLYQNLLMSPDMETTALFINFANDERYYDLRERRNKLRAKKDVGTLSVPEQSELKRVSEEFRQHRDHMRQIRHEDIAAIRAIVNTYHGDIELFLGGVSMVADDMISYIKNDLKVFGAGVFVLLVLMLGMIFGRLRWICLPMLCCAVSAIYMIGLLGWLGWEVTVVSSNFISLQLIMTLAIAIHLIVRYRELLLKNPESPNRQLLSQTVRLKLKPCVYAVLTTIAGFGSLVFCDILPVINFGWMMILGLIVSLAVTFLIFPSLLMLVGKEKLILRRWWHFPLTDMLARFTESGGIMIVAVSGLVLLLSLMGISRLEVENSFIDYFKKDSEIYQGMKVIDQSLGGTTPLDVIVEFEGSEEAAVTVTEDDDIFDEFEEYDEAEAQEKYWFTADKMSRIKTAHRYLDNLDETGKVLSLATMLSIVEKLNEGEALDSLELALLYNETPDEFKTMLIQPYVSVEHNEARFWLRVRDSEETLRRDGLLKQIKTELPDILGLEAGHVHLAGMLVLYNNMLQSLFGSQIVTLGITVLILMGMFGVLFRSLKIAFIAIFPNILSIGVVLGIMGWLDIPLDMMTITIAAIGIGIAVDDTIHYIHRFKAEFSKDRNYLATMHRCHGSIGHAMYYTSVTIIIGFSILALSNFIPTIYFGLLTGLAMLIALIAALTLLPEMLILVKPFGKENSSIHNHYDEIELT